MELQTHGKVDTKDIHPENQHSMEWHMYEHPVYADPGSNTWFGMQAWSMLRMVDLYLESGNKMAEELLDKWVPWVLDVTEVEDGGTIYIPSGLDWSGEPDTWTGRRSANSSLRVKVTSRGQDLGVAGALANCLITYAAAVERHKGSRTELANKALKLGKDIVDTIWTIYRTDKGVMAPELVETSTASSHKKYMFHQDGAEKCLTVTKLNLE